MDIGTSALARDPGPLCPYLRKRHGKSLRAGKHHVGGGCFTSDRRAGNAGVVLCASSSRASGGGVNPMGGPNFWSYSSPGDYSSPMNYQSPMQYGTPFQYSPPATDSGDGGDGIGSGGKRRTGFGGEGEDGGKFLRKLNWLAAFLYAFLGLVGYFVGGSTMSLIGGACLSAPFALAGPLMALNTTLGVVFGLIFSALIFAYCYSKYAKSKKVMPAGVLFGFSTYTLLAYLKVIMGF